MGRADEIASAPAQSSVSNFWWAAHNAPQDPSTSFAGKIVVITGSNSGIGFEAALKLAALGVSKLIFGVRSIARGQAAKKQIEQVLGSSFDPNTIEIVELDMLTLASVDRFVQQINSRFNKIHAAVLNAGVAPLKHNRSSEGWESSIQVNVLSTTYLALLLLPKLRQSATPGSPTHLEFVASAGHGDVAISSVHTDRSILDKVNDEKNFSFLKQYSISKLLQMYAMNQVASRVSPQEVIVLAVCPSLTQSELAREASFVVRKIDDLWKSVFGRTPEAGSRLLVSGLTLGTEAHGGFWSNDRISKQGSLVISDKGKEINEKFWRELIRVLKQQRHDVESGLQ